jgi:hypothetical protein
MLHNQDSDMLLTDPNNKNAVYRMDLEYGKVVDEWKVHDSINVENILPECVSAQASLSRAFADYVLGPNMLR